MGQEEQALPKKKGVSLLNWMGTLLLSAIPGVNIIFLVFTAIFSKSRAKHTYALAALILTLIFAIIVVAAFIFFGDELVDFARWLSEQPAK